MADCMNESAVICQAAPEDARRLSGLMGAAFHYDPVSCWLFPDDGDRLQRQPRFFRVFLDHALRRGQVYTTTDYDGVALWLPVAGPVGGGTDEQLDQLARALGPNLDRFKILSGLMESNHPTEVPHAFLPFVAVAPECQGHGLGGAMLREHLVRLDPDRNPAYLEASSRRSQRLYERLGFRDVGSPLQLPDGPCLYPMWRQAPPLRRGEDPAS